MFKQWPAFCYFFI